MATTEHFTINRAILGVGPSAAAQLAYPRSHGVYELGSEVNYFLAMGHKQISLKATGSNVCQDLCKRVTVDSKPGVVGSYCLHSGNA